jgi:hypothetical protein
MYRSSACPTAGMATDKVAANTDNKRFMNRSLMRPLRAWM